MITFFFLSVTYTIPLLAYIKVQAIFFIPSCSTFKAALVLVSNIIRPANWVQKDRTILAFTFVNFSYVLFCMEAVTNFIQGDFNASSAQVFLHTLEITFVVVNFPVCCANRAFDLSTNTISTNILECVN